MHLNFAGESAASCSGRILCPDERIASFQEKHHPVLLKLLAEQLKVQPEDIVDFELNICDVQPGTIGGAL